MKKFINTGNKGQGYHWVKNWASVALFIVLTLLWELASRMELVDAFLLPAPSIVISALFTNLPQLKEHILVTVYEAMMGFVFAVLLAMIIAVIMDSIPLVKRAVYPLLITSQTVPIITLAPLFAIWFGFGYLPKIVIVVLVCFFPITISLMEGLASVEIEMINLLRSMGASQWQLYRIVKLPAALPNFFAGLKISATYSIMAAIIGEWVGGKRGLGVYMMRVRYSFAIDKVFAVIVLITLLSIGVLKVIQLLELVLMPWNKHLKKDMEE